MLTCIKDSDPLRIFPLQKHSLKDAFHQWPFLEGTLERKYKREFDHAFQRV